MKVGGENTPPAWHLQEGFTCAYVRRPRLFIIVYRKLVLLRQTLNNRVGAMQKLPATKSDFRLYFCQNEMLLRELIRRNKARATYLQRCTSAGLLTYLGNEGTDFSNSLQEVLKNTFLIQLSPSQFLALSWTWMESPKIVSTHSAQSHPPPVNCTLLNASCNIMMTGRRKRREIRNVYAAPCLHLPAVDYCAARDWDMWAWAGEEAWLRNCVFIVSSLQNVCAYKMNWNETNCNHLYT